MSYNRFTIRFAIDGSWQEIVPTKILVRTTWPSFYNRLQLTVWESEEADCHVNDVILLFSDSR